MKLLVYWYIALLRSRIIWRGSEFETAPHLSFVKVRFVLPYRTNWAVIIFMVSQKHDLNLEKLPHWGWTPQQRNHRRYEDREPRECRKAVSNQKNSLFHEWLCQHLCHSNCKIIMCRFVFCKCNLMASLYTVIWSWRTVCNTVVRSILSTFVAKIIV